MPPKSVDKSHKMIYPQGCKEINDELGKDELLKRLKILARAFQEMGQDENNKYGQLALYLASEFFLDHPSKDVRLLVACCIADVFRIFAPEAPYTDNEHLKEIFMFLTRQLKGLDDTESPSFKRYFYLLENLAWVKSFNICIELEDNQDIFTELYKTMFLIANEKHSSKVINFMLDMMAPLITESDGVSQDLLDSLLINIIEPHKSQRRVAYGLAKDLIKRTANALEPNIQAFFNNALMLGKESSSSLSSRLYDMVFELNQISPSILYAVLPQLEFKLKSSDEVDRRAVTKLLAKMFSDPNADLANQNKPLWLCFIGRFNDIDNIVRLTCVQASQDFLVNHKDLVKDISEPLSLRQHDADENIRLCVIQAIVGAAKKDIFNVTPELLECVKERTLDKKFKVRREALTGLGQIYKMCSLKEGDNANEMERIGWVKNKVLYAYYQQSIEDRVLVERILNTALVPYSLDPDRRMKQLFYLYSTIDNHSIKALQEVFKTQLMLRNCIRSLLELHTRELSTEVSQLMMSRIQTLARNLPDPPKALEYMKKFNKYLQEESRIRGYLIRLVSPECSCKKAEEYVKDTLKQLGNAIPQNYVYANVKTLLERIAPVMIDADAITSLMKLVEEVLNGVTELGDDIEEPVEKAMKLLLLLAHIYPGAFQTEEVYLQLMSLVKHEDDTVSDVTMQLFTKIGQRIEHQYPNIYSSLLPVLQKMIRMGNPKQAKHAIRCIEKIFSNKDGILGQVFEHLKKNLDLESPYFLSTLVAVGHIAQICPGQFAAPVKTIVSKFLVKELLMQDRTEQRRTSESWYADKFVSEETQAKMQALKLMVRWLLGMKDLPEKPTNSANSMLKLLQAMIGHDGDLMEQGRVNRAEMSRLRLKAACCMLTLAQESCYADLITLEQFQAMALLLNDPCIQVRTILAQKLQKGLISLRLPLQYMSCFALAANDPIKERKVAVKQFLISNIAKRRDYLKQNSSAVSSKMFSLLPDYVLPYAIHLLAHDPELVSNEDVVTLRQLRDCLWFIMDPLISKNENYSFSFYRRMIENIKQTKDKQNPNDEARNKKLYAVCDLATGLILTKTANYKLKDFPAEPVLPAKLFTQPDPNYSNTKSYLPSELMIISGKGNQSLKKVATYVPPKVRKETDDDSEKSDTDADDTNDLSSSPPEASPPRARQPSRGASQNKAPGRRKRLENTDEEDEDIEEEVDVKPRGRGRGAAKKTTGAKGQGKITDFVQSRGRGRPKKQDTITLSPSSTPTSSPKSSPVRGRGRPPLKQKGVTSNEPVSNAKKRPASTEELTPTKRSKRTGIKGPSRLSPEIQSPKKRFQQKSHEETLAKSRRSGASNQDSDLSPSSKSSSSVASSRRASQTSSKKNTPARGKMRRSNAVQNGTSDGEEDSHSSRNSRSTPRKKAASKPVSVPKRTSRRR